MAVYHCEVRIIRTDDFLVGPIFARSDVDKIKHNLAAGKATHKIFKKPSVLNGTGAREDLGKALDISVDAANDARFNRNVVDFMGNVVADGRVKLRSSTATAQLTILEIIILKNHAIAIDKGDNEGITVLT